MTTSEQQESSEQDAPETEPPTNQDSSGQPNSIAEWISLAIAASLLTMVIGLVVFLWVSDRQTNPPILEITAAEVRQSADQFYVPFEVTNTGGITAESVQVVAKLHIDGITVESGEQIIDFLSSQETASGAFVFTHNPRQGELVIRVASYQDP
jgi:uncharacterized protein (TIGR02588 family)